MDRSPLTGRNKARHFLEKERIVKRTTTWFSALACAAMVSTGTLAMSAPPTDAEVRQAVQSFSDWQRSNPQSARDIQAIREQINSIFGELNIDEMSAAQLSEIANITRYSPTLTERVQGRLTELAPQPNADGAIAASMMLQSAFGMGEDEQRQMFQKALTHPGLGDALAMGKCGEVFSFVGYLPEPVLKSLAKEVMGVGQHLKADLPATIAPQAVDYLVALNKLGDDVKLEFREDVRQKLLGLMDHSLATLTDEQKQMGYENFLTGMKSFLDGAFAKGQLINHSMPEMTIAWSSDESIDSFDDLKGKVVVLDFWATWCGPCIASFPNVRELQAHYEGYDVAIIGVTSLQGTHFGHDGQRTDTKDNPDLEHSLMPGFMKAKDMTWPVVFTEQEVFNPDFGVRGIPHVAIIDPDGKVRFNGLHPASPLHEKTEKIDKLLKEAGKPAPVTAENTKNQQSGG